MLKSAYSKGRQDAAEPLAAKNREMKNKLELHSKRTEKLLEDLCKETGFGFFKKRKIREYLEEYKKNKIPWTFDIKIIYEKDKDYAECTRKSLNNGMAKGNSAYCVRYSAYKNQQTNPTDYTIFLENSIDEMPKKYEVIHDAFGCLLAVSNTHIFLNYDIKKIGDSKKFLDYYYTMVNDEMEFCYQQERIMELIEKSDMPEDEKVHKLTKKVSQVVDDTKVKDMAKKDGLAYGALMGLFMKVGNIITPPIIVGLEISLIKKTIKELEKGRRDKEILEIAQKQILQVCLCDYIRKEQVRHAI